MKKIAIFASGSGSNAKKIIEYFNGHSDIEVSLVVCNVPKAGVMTVAFDAGIKAEYVDKNQLQNEKTVAALLNAHNIDFIALAGFLLLIPTFLIQSHHNKILNIHPSLLPDFGGKGMYGSKVHNAVIGSKVIQSGLTIHLVNEKYDEGKILFPGYVPCL